MLEAEGVNFEDVDAHNILAQEEMRTEMKDFSDWPTFPQVHPILMQTQKRSEFRI